MSKNYQEVSSSAISGATYDDVEHSLIVHMVKGDDIKYKGVSHEVFMELIKSSSSGAYYNKYIKNNYPFSYV